jgi:uncharacterized protein YcgI (DUF1989 family)
LQTLEGATAMRVGAGDVVRIVQSGGPRIVHLFAISPRDPDERLWVQESLVNDGIFLSRFSRVWGTMARYRPLLTVIEETVNTSGRNGHHFIIGGVAVNDALRELLVAYDLDPAALKDELTLFSRVALDPETGSIEQAPSAAVDGDSIAFLAEAELLVFLVPGAGTGRPALEIHRSVAKPPPWPLPGMAYPDLSLYHDARQVRNTRAEPTRGLSATRAPSDEYDQLVAGGAHSAASIRVPAGHRLRMSCPERPQIVDLNLFSALDPSEHYAAGVQVNREGIFLRVGQPIWGSAGRPLAVLAADTLPPNHHKTCGAHCNPHHWVYFAGRHPHTCYDNLRAACAQAGLSQRAIHDNLNLFQRSHIDPVTGHQDTVESYGRPGDSIEIRAEIDLLACLSLCPYGDGSVEPADWANAAIPVTPIRLQVLPSPGDFVTDPVPFRRTEP